MIPIKMPSTNLVFAPKADAEEHVKDAINTLPVSKDIAGIMHSFWQPSEEDIANILAGLPIRLSVMSIGHPPVALTVTDEV